MTDRQFTITRTFDVPRERIWQAWTDPAIAARWWHPHGVTTKDDSVRIDLREGGSYTYTMVSESGEEYPTGGTYLEVREPERLRFTWGSPGDGDDAPVVTVDLRDSDGRTEMTFHVLGVDDDSGSPESIHDGWVEAFENLEEVVG